MNKIIKHSQILTGLWQLAGGHGEINQELANKIFLKSIDSGFYVFDMADIYTGVEEKFGSFLKKLQESDPHLASKIKIHTKCVPDKSILPVLKPINIIETVERSISRLNVKRLDLVQFHWWDFKIKGYLDAIQTLDKLKKAGKITEIGLTNFDTKRLQEIISTGVKIKSIQIQYSLVDRRVEKNMLEIAIKNNIQFYCYGTLAGGFLTNKWLGAKKSEINALENRSLVKYLLIIEEIGGWDTFQKLLVFINEIAIKKGLNIAQIANLYILQKDNVAGIIIGASKNYFKNNLNLLLENLLSDLEISSINNFINKNLKPLYGDVYQLERESLKHSGIIRTNENKKN